MVSASLKSIVFVLVVAVAAGEELEVFTVPSEPNRLNRLNTRLSQEEGSSIADTKFYVLEGSVDIELIGEVWVYTAGPGTVSRVLLVAARTKGDEVQVVSKLFLLTFGGARPPPVVVPDPNSPRPGPRKAVRATWVHEREQSTVPREIQAALRKLNQEGIVASAVDKDVKTGEGQVPDQYKEAIRRAVEFGLPALCVEFSDGSAAVSKPRTQQDVLDAVK